MQLQQLRHRLSTPGLGDRVAAYAVGGTAKAVDIKVTPIRP